jgi:hypothetical protein
MKRAATLVAVSLSALSLAACASAGTGAAKLGTVKEPESFNQAEVEYDSKFSNRPAVQRVRVPGGLFISRPMEGIAPSSLLDKRVEIDIRSDVPTLADLQTLLDVQGVPMTIDWKSLESGTKKNSRVCNFTAASRYQNVANSVTGGSGVQNNGGGGLNGGLNNGGLNNGGLNNGGLNNGGLNNGGLNSGGLNSGGLSNGNGGNGNNNQIVGSFDEDKECIEDNDSTSVSGQTSADGSDNRSADAASNSGNIRRKVPAIYDRSLPFRYFKGSVGELMRRLETAGNIAVWYDGGLVVGDVRRFSVSVMQNRDIVQSVVNELIRLGAKNVTGSIGAGQIFYEAPPRTNSEILEPYLRRLQGNLSEVTLQVALVTVSMTHNAERGFDWSAFNFGYGANVTNDTLAANVATGTDAGTGTGTGTGTTGVSAANRLGSGVFTLNNNALNANLGDVLGTGKILSVAGAIKFLSRMGNTSVAQNVELRTLSGSPVILRSGESIPFVQNVGASLGGGLGGGALGSSQTASIGTGLTLNVDPRYDHTSGIVTMDIGLRLVDLVEFVQLNAGAQLGTLTQPRTREQGINSILRLEAGQTAILGGIRRDLTSDSRTGPLDAFAIGSRNRSREVFWLFAIVRPVVTVYETADVPLSPRSVLDTNVTVNPLSDGSYGNRGYGNAGVATSAPPVARDVEVIAPSTPATVSPLVAPRAVVRERPAPISRTEVPASNVPATPAPRVVAEPVVQQPAPKRSFIRPMSDAEKGSN